MNKRLIRKLFASGDFFTIAIRLRQGDILQSGDFQAKYVVPATRDEWCADPMLVEDGDRTFLFFEKVHGDLGSIEVAEVLDGCRLSESKPVLSDGSHCSYPFLFQVNSTWYMIPETSAKGEVSLFEAKDFPFQWKKKQTLLQKAGVDTTVFQLNGFWYLLTFLPHTGSERVTPEAYRLEGSQLKRLEWKNANELMVRGAGKPFEYQGKLIRPVQISTDLRYGDGIAFMEICVAEDCYQETLIRQMDPRNIRARLPFFDGLHTYTFTDKYEAIDIRCAKLDAGKPIKKIQGFLNRK